MKEDSETFPRGAGISVSVGSSRECERTYKMNYQRQKHKYEGRGTVHSPDISTETRKSYQMK